MQLLFPFVFLALMWVLLVRPQQQRVRQQRDLVASLEIDDEVVTAGGILGRIVSLTDEEATLQVAPGVNMRFLRGAVNSRLTQASESDERAELTDAAGEGTE
ncbi:MAG TPA: preprotein translocase subunit YajC [Acidimicrobiales bacterium]|nr:preprotein translocase subunit YajC [Acidimicrobiales bacterium]